jgi:hypothetical protein
MSLKMKSKFRLILFMMFLSVIGTFAQEKTGISGIVEWDNMQIKAVISLDLASAGIRLPSGRTRGESILKNSYVNLMRPYILELQADSSSTIADFINRGEFSLYEAEAIMLKAHSVPPVLSPDMQNMTVSYNMPLSGISSTLLNHSRAAEVMRTLNPVSAADYTGIIIIASEELPVHSMRSAVLPVPCLFPKIWDNEMNLIYERSMLASHDNSMVHYYTVKNIYQNNPSGLSPELRKIVGDRPLRVFASGVYGIKPTDLIIDRNDALLIISSDNNRRLLSEGKVAIILDDSVLKKEFKSDE